MSAKEAPKRLPASPNLRHLQKQAKDLRKAIQRGDPDALRRVREFHPKRSVAAQTPKGISLSDAKLVIAREHGFASWPTLKAHIEARHPVADAQSRSKGVVVTGIVRHFDDRLSMIVDLGKTDGILPRRFQTPQEIYRPKDRILTYVHDLGFEKTGRRPILSRTDVGLLLSLFQMEVPELYEGIVRIVEAERDPGVRSKITVTSRASDVDPVHACVGIRRIRVQAIERELQGEKIEIVPL